MTDKERLIQAALKWHPGEVYITPDGTELYLLVPGGMMCLTGPDFNTMDEEAVNWFIQDMWSNLKKD